MTIRYVSYHEAIRGYEPALLIEFIKPFSHSNECRVYFSEFSQADDESYDHKFHVKNADIDAIQAIRLAETIAIKHKISVIGVNLDQDKRH
jgi:hypothetical protein